MVERRIWQRDFRDKHALQPDVLSYPEMVPPIASRENTSNAVTTRFVKTATNKVKYGNFPVVRNIIGDLLNLPYWFMNLLVTHKHFFILHNKSTKRCDVPYSP